MYDHLRGEVTDSQPARVVVHVAGIGYEVKVPTSTSAKLRPGDSATLYLLLHVVDGQPQLLGFSSKSERELGRKLLGVQGVGPSMCLALSSTLSPGEISRAILDGDAGTLKKVKGVGAKTAERLCLELRDAIAKLGFVEAAEVAPSAGAPEEPTDPVKQDAVAGLLTLGFTEKEAHKKVSAAAKASPDAGTEDLITLVLRSS